MMGNLKPQFKKIKTRIREMKKRDLILLIVSIAVGIYVCYTIIGVITQNVIPYLTKCGISDNIDGTISVDCDLTALGATITDISIGAVIALLIFKIRTDQAEKLTKVTRNVTEKVYSRNVDYYTADIAIEEPEGNDPETAERRAMYHAQRWVKNIQDQATGVKEVEIEGRGKALELTLKDGVIQVTIPTITRQYRGTYTKAARIHIRTNEFKLFDEILSSGKLPYWDLRWYVVPKYDAHNLNSKIFEATGRIPSSSSGVGTGEEAKILLATYPLIPNDNSIVAYVGVDYVSLTYQAFPENKGFFKAHRIFMPEKIIAILLGEIELSEVQEMLKQSKEP